MFLKYLVFRLQMVEFKMKYLVFRWKAKYNYKYLYF